MLKGNLVQEPCLGEQPTANCFLKESPVVGRKDPENRARVRGLPLRRHRLVPRLIF